MRHASSQENAEFLAIVARDGEAFGRWLARSEDTIRCSLGRFARDVDVEGVVQETALRVWQHAPGIEPDGKPDLLLRWAKRVSRNLAIDTVRRTAGELPVDPEADPAGPPLIAPSDPFLAERIAHCLARLPSKPAAAIRSRLTDGGGSPDRQLAARVEMSFDAFRQNLARGRRLLEACLERFGIKVREARS